MARLPPGIVKLPSGRYRWRTQIDGRRFSGTESSVAEARRAKADAELTHHVDPGSMTVADIIAAEAAESTVAPTTRDADRAAVAHLPDWFLSAPAAQVGPADVGRLWQAMTRAGVSGWSMQRAGQVLSKSFRFAAGHGWVGSNPLSQVRTPKPSPSAEAVPPDPDDVRRILERLSDRPVLALAVRVAAVTGVRRGELVAVQWGDLRVDAAELVVRRSVSESAGRLHVGETKTGRKGHRTVPLDPVTVAGLRAHRLDAPVGCPWIFTHDGRSPWRPNYVSLAFRRAARDCGVDCSVHDLRHFAATQWLGAGVAPSIVAGLLGHASVSTTLRTYAHHIPAHGRDVITRHAAVLDG